MRVHITSLTPPLVLKFLYRARILSCHVSILTLFLHLNCYDSDLFRGRFICFFIFCLFFVFPVFFSFLWGGGGVRGLGGSCACVIIWLYLFLFLCFCCFVLFCFVFAYVYYVFYCIQIYCVCNNNTTL